MELRIGPSCTARRDERDGDNEDVRKRREHVRNCPDGSWKVHQKYAKYLLQTIRLYALVHLWLRGNVDEAMRWYQQAPRVACLIGVDNWNVI